MGAFDDLIPAQDAVAGDSAPSTTGAFDDLIPADVGAQSTAPTAPAKPSRALADAVDVGRAATDRKGAQDWAWDKVKTAGRAVLGMAQPQETVLDKAQPVAPSGPSSPSPVDPAAFADMKAALGAMPLQQRRQM